MTRLLPLLLVLVACSARDGALEYTGNDAPDEGLAEGTLRIDVLPPTDAGDGTLLPQSSIVLPGAYEALRVDLLPTRTLTGTLTAEVARGWSFGAPTTEEPLVATLQHLPGDGRISGVTSSAEDGSFTLAFPAYAGNPPIAIVPADAAVAPFRVVAAPSGDGAWSQTLAPGIPIYGRVSGEDDGEALGVGGVRMRISRRIDDEIVRSGVFTSDATGWYVARVDEPGEYTLEVIGGQTEDLTDGRVAPSVTVDVLVEDEAGVELPIALGTVSAAQVDGLVLGPSGAAAPAPRLRFTSRSLDGGGSLVVEATGQSGGDFIVRDLLPGRYDIEVMPEPSATPVASPVRLVNQRVTADTELGTIRLPAASRLSGVVSGAGGDPAGQALVVVTEVGFGGNVYYTYTDGRGRFDLAVPDVPLTVTLTPSVPADGAVTSTALDAPATDLSLALDLGVLVSGELAFQGQPVAFGSVEVRDALTGALLGQTISADDGSFSLRVSVPEHDEDTTDTGDDTDTGVDTDTADTGDTGDDTGVDTDTADTGDTGDDTDTGDTADTGTPTDTADSGGSDTAR